MDYIYDNAMQTNQSSDTKGRNLGQDWHTLCSLAKENGWTKDEEDITKFWKERKYYSWRNIYSKRTEWRQRWKCERHILTGVSYCLDLLKVVSSRGKSGWPHSEWKCSCCLVMFVFGF